MSQLEDTVTIIDAGRDERSVAVPVPEQSPSGTSLGAWQRVRKVSRGRVGQIVGIILFGAAFIMVWEGAFRLKIFSKFIIPSAFSTLHEIERVLVDVFTGGANSSPAINTIEEVALGFVFGSAAGIILGIIVGETAFGRRILMPYVVAFNSVPKVALAPLFVAALGFGVAPKILMAAIVAFFPVVVNQAAGIEAANDNELMLFRAIEANRWQTFWKLKMPTSLPFLFAGLKVAATLSVIGAVVADILSGGTGGLGRQILTASIDLRTATIFALVVLLSIVGLVVFLIVMAAEHYIVHWRRPGERRR